MGDIHVYSHLQAEKLPQILQQAAAQKSRTFWTSQQPSAVQPGRP